MRMLSRFCFAPLTLLCALIGGCGSEDDPTVAGSGDEVVAELFPSTIELNAEALNALSPLDGTATLTFSSTPTQLASVKRGSVLLAGVSPKTPKGLLRIVRSVSSQGTSLALETAPVPLQAAYRKLRLKGKRSIPDFGNVPGWIQAPKLPAAGGGEHKYLDVNAIIFDGDKDESTLADQAKVVGQVGGGYDYVIGVQFDWGSLLELPVNIAECLASELFGPDCDPKKVLPELKVGLDVAGDLVGNVDLQGAAMLEYRKPYEISSVVLDPVCFTPVLCFFPTITITAEISGQASSSFHIGISANASSQIGFSYSSRDGWVPPAVSFEKNFASTAQDVTLAANGRVDLKAELALKLWTVAGPSTGLSAFAELSADQSKTPCWDLQAGLDFLYGFEIELDVPLFGPVEFIKTEGSETIASTSVATGSCQLPPNGTVVPGSGPNAETFANPSFQPWARAFNGALHAMAHNDVEGLYATRLQRGIDGHFTVSSREASALLKVSDTGKLVWATTYRDPTAKPNAPPLFIQDTVSLGDATLLAITYPPGLVKIGQSGGVYWAKSLPLPTTKEGGPNGDNSTQSSILATARDGNGGAWLAGTLVPASASKTDAFLLQVDQEGNLISGWTWSDPSRFVYPTVLVRQGEDIVVSGFLWDSAASPTSDGFAMRLRKDGTVVWATTFAGAEYVRPAAGIVHSSGHTVVAGAYGPYAGFFLRLSDSGELVTCNASQPSSSVSRLTLNSIRELPTTGFIVTGRFNDDYKSPGLFLGGLDSQGSMLWARHYRQQMATGDLIGENNFPALVLQDDGSVVVAALSSIPNSTPGSYWVFKAAAKDGSLEFNDGSTSKEAQLKPLLGPQNLKSWQVSPTKSSLSLSSLSVVTEAPTITVTQQTP